MSNPTGKLYEELDDPTRKLQTETLKGLWKDFIKENSEAGKTQVFINEYSLIEVVERVSKRKFYYKAFHGIEHLAEFKEVALLCFWICKLKPFVVLDPNSKLCASPNELFSVFLIYRMLNACKEHTFSDRQLIYPDNVTINNLVYALKYQDLSKEALLLYCETLAISCGIDIHSVAHDKK